MAAKIPLVMRVDPDLKDRVVKKYPGRTVTESVVAALEASLVEGGTTIEPLTTEYARREDLNKLEREINKIEVDIQKELDTVKESIDSLANQI